MVPIESIRPLFSLRRGHVPVTENLSFSNPSSIVSQPVERLSAHYISVFILIGFRLLKGVVDSERKLRILNLPHLFKRFSKAILEKLLRLLFTPVESIRRGDEFLLLRDKQCAKNVGIHGRKRTTQPHIEKI